MLCVNAQFNYNQNLEQCISVVLELNKMFNPNCFTKLVQIMKANLLNKMMVVALFLFVAGVANAQTIKYTWKDYGVAFSIPTTHEVKNSSGSEFTSGDNTTWLHMEPFKDYSETAKGMVDKIVRKEGYQVSGEGEYHSGGYDGYWARCSATTHPDWLYWVIGFIDPASDTNFYATIWWKKGNSNAYNIAYNISYSFKKMP
ncbi:MAG: hypothetical protein ACI85I_000955 [Arenicella sp.]